MEVTSDRTYRLSADTPTVWQAISAVGDYQRWWPWLRRFDAHGLHEGDVWQCTVQPPVPYALRFSITLDEVRPHELVRARVGGDVIGSAVLRLAGGTAGEAGCEARLVSALSPGNRALRLVATMAAPVVRFGHDWVLDTGARQFSDRAL